MTLDAATWTAIGAVITALGAIVISLYGSKQTARKDEVATLRAMVDDLGTKYSELLKSYRSVIDDLNNARGELALARADVTRYHTQVIELSTRVDVLTKRNQALEAILRERGVEIPAMEEDA